MPWHSPVLLIEPLLFALRVSRTSVVLSGHVPVLINPLAIVLGKSKLAVNGVGRVVARDGGLSGAEGDEKSSCDNSGKWFGAHRAECVTGPTGKLYRGCQRFNLPENPCRFKRSLQHHLL